MTKLDSKDSDSLTYYRRSHIGDVAVDYDDILFSNGTYNQEDWKKEKMLLDERVGKWAPGAGSYLDFACAVQDEYCHILKAASGKALVSIFRPICLARQVNE